VTPRRSASHSPCHSAQARIRGGRRLKAKGTSWYRRGAHHLLTLRMLKQNDTWNRYWAARRSRTSMSAALVA
jgi:hypothetical protein